MASNCLYCHKVVSDEDYAISCDNCELWQHIKCGRTKITITSYEKAVKNKTKISWKCKVCKGLEGDSLISELNFLNPPCGESTRNPDASDFFQLETTNVSEAGFNMVTQREQVL